LEYIARSFLGFFPSADIASDVNSPLWYITLIIFFYLVFPLLFSSRRPLLSAGFIVAAGYVAHELALPFISPVAHLHELHLWAFPVGMALAAILNRKETWSMGPVAHVLALTALAGAVGYLAINGNVGSGVALQQGTSVLTALLVCAFFVIKKFEIRLLYLFGVFSYEIYLFHWPIMYRYDIFFQFLPPWLAMFLYLALFLGVGWLFQYLTKLLSGKSKSSPQT
ncbi:hypothetical protein K2X83_00740, partial [Patescibacteria group bacterium]|nr:hypothetical protein [Patescibacteria group bacterium]